MTEFQRYFFLIIGALMLQILLELRYPNWNHVISTIATLGAFGIAYMGAKAIVRFSKN